MDERYAELHVLQQEIHDRIAGIGRRIDTATGPIHPAELQGDVRALHDAFARLKAKAEALTRTPLSP
ncbi:MAG TPA: hypothetical protein VHT53_01245 [Candidatus Elarobacter sp.]|jgi:hypothetical protein|nr:hypothetical protein [Candidatus Elarobacter sp.]